jgi:hypothetical protein
MSLNRPRTQVTVVWRALNSAYVWPGSKIQVLKRIPLSRPAHRRAHRGRHVGRKSLDPMRRPGASRCATTTMMTTTISGSLC